MQFDVSPYCEDYLVKVQTKKNCWINILHVILSPAPVWPPPLLPSVSLGTTFDGQ